MLRTAWKPGPADAARPVLVSVTDFTSAHLLDMPRIYWTGTRLARLWPELEGAVGLWLWAEPRQRRTGAVSLWRDHEDLMGFVRLPAHRKIMRTFRDRGSVRSTTWTENGPEPREVWHRAAEFLADGVPGASRQN